MTASDVENVINIVPKVVDLFKPQFEKVLDFFASTMSSAIGCLKMQQSCVVVDHGEMYSDSVLERWARVAQLLDDDTVHQRKKGYRKKNDLQKVQILQFYRQCWVVKWDLYLNRAWKKWCLWLETLWRLLFSKLMVILIKKASSPEKYFLVLIAACVKRTVTDSRLKTLMWLQMAHLQCSIEHLKLKKERTNLFELAMLLLCLLIT